jgi:hypothetical protein
MVGKRVKEVLGFESGILESGEINLHRPKTDGSGLLALVARVTDEDRLFEPQSHPG